MSFSIIEMIRKILQTNMNLHRGLTINLTKDWLARGVILFYGLTLSVIYDIIYIESEG